jgi:hypothetical protein
MSKIVASSTLAPRLVRWLTWRPVSAPAASTLAISSASLTAGYCAYCARTSYAPIITVTMSPCWNGLSACCASICAARSAERAPTCARMRLTGAATGGVPMLHSGKFRP